ncbi:MAG: hypothetical protein IJT73_04925 [Selenomonadaceae bacterium]|nr:hypothetical protein [Selenomonadaceae bacterium]
MGVIDWIGSGIKAVRNAISGGIKAIGSKIASGVSSAISTLGNLATKAAGSFLGKVVGKAASFLGMASKVIGSTLGPVVGPIIIPILVELVVGYIVEKIVSKLAEESGVVEKGEKTEEIGYRLEEAQEHEDWKRREDFSSFKEYYSYLKEEIPAEKINQEKIKQNEYFYSMLGMEAEIEAIEEKFGIKIPRNSLIVMGKCKMELKEVQAFLRAFNKLGYINLNISEYLQGRLAAGELERITAAVMDALKLYYPDKTESGLLTRLTQMRRASNDDKVVFSLYKDEFQEKYGEAIKISQQNGELPPEAEKLLTEVQK